MVSVIDLVIVIGAVGIVGLFGCYMVWDSYRESKKAEKLLQETRKELEKWKNVKP